MISLDIGILSFNGAFFAMNSNGSVLLPTIKIGYVFGITGMSLGYL